MACAVRLRHGICGVAGQHQERSDEKLWMPEGGNVAEKEKKNINLQSALMDTAQGKDTAGQEGVVSTSIRGLLSVLLFC